MPIPLAQARALVADLQTAQIATLFAQAHAKHVLHEVKETEDNFPAFDAVLDDKVTVAAYALLAAGCSIIEQGERSEGAAAMERAASLLHYVHGPAPRTRGRAVSTCSLRAWRSTGRAITRARS
jgi:hypothetical protein